MNFSRLTLTALFSLMMLLGTSQYNFDFGFKLGGANYLGEIGGKEKTRRDFVMDMKLRQTSWVFGGYARYKFTKVIAGSISASYGQIRGDDALSSNIGRSTRNLRFKNNIIDITARGEYYFFEANDVGNHGRYWVDFKAFAHIGVTGFYHNPRGSADGSSWTKLQPLQTEGIKYSKFQAGIPGGLGFYFTYKRKHRIGWDISWTTTFTDYLDDISTVYTTGPNDGSIANQSAAATTDQNLLGSFQVGEKRGDPTHNDTYMFTTLSYGYVLRGSSTFYRQSYGWLSGRKSRSRKVRAKF